MGKGNAACLQVSSRKPGIQQPLMRMLLLLLLRFAGWRR